MIWGAGEWILDLCSWILMRFIGSGILNHGLPPVIGLSGGMLGTDHRSTRRRLLR